MYVDATRFGVQGIVANGAGATSCSKAALELGRLGGYPLAVNVTRSVQRCARGEAAAPAVFWPEEQRLKGQRPSLPANRLALWSRRIAGHFQPTHPPATNTGNALEAHLPMAGSRQDSEIVAIEKDNVVYWLSPTPHSQSTIAIYELCLVELASVFTRACHGR